MMLVTMSFTILSLTNFIGNSNNIYDIKDHTNLNIILSNSPNAITRVQSKTSQKISPNHANRTTFYTESDNELNQES